MSSKKSVAAICFVLALMLFLGGWIFSKSSKSAEGMNITTYAGHSGDILDYGYIGRDESRMRTDSIMSMFLYASAFAMLVFGVIKLMAPDTKRIYGTIVRLEGNSIILRMDSGMQANYRYTNDIGISVGDVGIAVITDNKLTSFKKTNKGIEDTF